jgi:hypothetical protein
VTWQLSRINGAWRYEFDQNYELLVDLTGLFELGLELGAAIDLDGLDRERHLGMTFSRKADAAAARLKALPSGAVLTNRVSIWIRPPAYRV